MYSRGCKILDRAGAKRMIRRATMIRVADGIDAYKSVNHAGARVYIDSAPEPIRISEWSDNRRIAMWIN